MRITVTGAAGFIGRHLVNELRKHGHEVFAVDRRDGDLVNPGECAYLIQRSSPEVVVHLAAQVGRLFGDLNPGFTITQNAIMTCNVAKNAKECGARLVYASTSEVYGDQGQRDVYEDAPLKMPYNLYGLTKRWGEEVCELLHDDAAYLRLAMPFGPGLPAGKGRAAIINFLADSHNGRAITVHKDSERCWCWIGDTVCGIRMIAESAEQGPFNVGRDDNCCSMEQVARFANEITGSKSEIVLVDPPPNQVLVKRLKTRRLRLLGWAPTVDLRTGMEMTYRAMKEDGQL